MGEEAASAFANALAEVVIARDKSEWIRDINGYRKEGYSQKEAVARAFGDQMINVGISAVGGFLSGAALGGMAVIADNTVGRIRAERNTRDIQKAEEDEMVRGMEAWLAGKKASSGISYRIGRTEENEPIVIVEEDILDGVPEGKWADAVKKNLKKKFSEGITIRNDTIKINARTRNEITESEYSKQLKDKEKRRYADKFRATNNTDEILEASDSWVGEKPKHERNDNIVEFARGTVLMKVGRKSYSSEVVVATTKDGSMQLHDIVNMIPVKINLKSQTQTDATPETGTAVRSPAVDSNNSIPQSPPLSQENFNKPFAISRTLPRAGENSNVVLPTAKEQMERAQRQRRAAEAKTETERTGILYGATDENIEMAARISQAINREVVFYENADPNVKNDDGYYNNRDGKIYINAKSKNSVAHIIAHEMTHSVELADSYIDLFRTVIRRIQKTGGSISNMRNELKGRYARNGVQLSKTAQVDVEIMAEYIAKHLFTDEASITSLAAENRKGASAILRFLDNLLAKLGNTNARERIFIEWARSLYAKALNETRATTTDKATKAEPGAEAKMEHKAEQSAKTADNPSDSASHLSSDSEGEQETTKGEPQYERATESESHEKTKTESPKPETEGGEKDIESMLRQTFRPEIAENAELMQMLNERFGASGMTALARQIEAEVQKTGSVGKFGMLFSDGGRAVEEAFWTDETDERQFSFSKDSSEKNKNKSLQNVAEDDKIKSVGKTQDKSEGSKNVEIVHVGNGVTLSYTAVDSAQWTDEMRAVEAEGKEFGCKTFFTDGEMEKRNAEGELERTIRDGTCAGDSIYINKNTKYPLEMVAKHELVHLLKRRNAQAYEELYEKVILALDVGEYANEVEIYIEMSNAAYGVSTVADVAAEEILANLGYEIYSDDIPGFVADAEETKRIFDEFFNSHRNKELHLNSRGGEKDGVKPEENRFNGGSTGLSRPKEKEGNEPNDKKSDGGGRKNEEIWNFGQGSYIAEGRRENSGNRSENEGDKKQYAITKDGEETGDMEAESEVPAYGLDFWDEWLEKIREYGAMEKGEKPTRKLEVPKKVADDKPVSQTVRTVLEARVTPDEALPTLEQMVLDGDFSYTVHTDKQAI